MIGDEYFLINKKKERENKKRDNAYAEIKRYCKRCGHPNIILKQRKKIFCSFCGATVYYDEREEFKDKLKKRMR